MSRNWILALLLGTLLVGLLPWVFSLIPFLNGFGALFAPMCHQRPERTLMLNGSLMVVCSRCAGIYAGFILGAVSAMFLQDFKWFRQIAWFGIGMMLLDVVTQELGLRPPWHITRVSTGLLLGFVIAAWVPVLLLKDLKRVTIAPHVTEYK